MQPDSLNGRCERGSDVVGFRTAGYGGLFEVAVHLAAMSGRLQPWLPSPNMPDASSGIAQRDDIFTMRGAAWRKSRRRTNNSWLSAARGCNECDRIAMGIPTGSGD